MLVLSFALLTTICAECHNKVHYSEFRYAECLVVYARASFTMKQGFKSASVHLEWTSKSLILPSLRPSTISWNQLCPTLLNIFGVNYCFSLVRLCVVTGKVSRALQYNVSKTYETAFIILVENCGSVKHTSLLAKNQNWLKIVLYIRFRTTLMIITHSILNICSLKRFVPWCWFHKKLRKYALSLYIS